MLRILAAASLALSLATIATTPARAAAVLSDGTVTPTSGTTATPFTFSVHYTSTDSPTRPAQVVWAQVDGTTVTLTKVSGSAHDGTWEGAATLPAGTWQVTFHATTAAEPQPAPLPGPMVVVTAPPPTPQPTRPPTPGPTTRPPPPPPTTGPTPAPAIDEAPASTRSPSPTPTPSGSSTARPETPSARPSATRDAEDTAATPEPSEPATPNQAPPPGSMLASILFVGGTMSIAGAAVLARQWLVSRRERAAKSDASRGPGEVR